MSDPTAFDGCSSVTPDCPVSETILSYRPSLGANAFFVAIFATCLTAQIAAGIKWKTWTWMIAIAAGCIAQIIGYIGRLMLNDNPFSTTGFTMQISCLIIAPAFTTAAIYLTLKHFVIAFGRQYSLINPALYTWIFISGDLLSLVLQGVGGGIASGATTQSALNTGANIMLGGIGFQVGWLGLFAILCLGYFARVWMNRASLAPEAVALARSTNLRIFAFGVALAFITILIRCIYRIPELASGWASPLFQNETDFIVLDGVMMTIATLSLTIFHPGYFFPQLSAPFYDQQEAQRPKTLTSPWSSDGSEIEENKQDMPWQAQRAA